jgi:hypothetical protein
MVFELLDTDLQKIINSKQGLSGDHTRFFIYQVMARFQIRSRVLCRAKG